MRIERSAAALAVLVVASLLIAAAPAGAVITVSDGPGPALSALASSSFEATGPDFPTIASSRAAGIGDAASSLIPFPIAGGGDFLVLSTGDATLADHLDQAGIFPSVNNRGNRVTMPVDRGDTALDVTTFRVDFIAEAPSCLGFDFRFLSEEYPEFIASRYNDAFVAELDTTSWTTSDSEISGLANDFALDPDGNPVTIKSTGPTSMSPAEAAGTPYGGATAPLHAQILVPQAGLHTLYLSVFDQADHKWDTTVFVDNVTLTQAASCPRGSAGLGPAVAITGPAAGGTVDTPTPTLSGIAGDAPGDASTVTVRIYDGPVATGAPVQTLSVPRSGTAWSAVTGALAPGQYTAQASQTNGQGIDGVSGAVTFTVLPRAAQARPSQQSPGDRDGDGIPDDVDDNDGSRPPVPGKSVDVRVVSGEVFVKYPAGRSGRAAGSEGFVPLEGAANIPMGSQLDTSGGRVALTSAVDTGAAKTQTADFYQGIFQVKQTVPKKKPKKPAALVTDIALKGGSASQCKPLKGARAVGAKKKGPKSVLGKLWGNGKGKFRTSGKYSSATVRGTIWLTQDECDGTLTNVSRGTVVVRDFKAKKTVTVKAGHSYLARAQRAASKARRR